MPEWDSPRAAVRRPFYLGQLLVGLGHLVAGDFGSHRRPQGVIVPWKLWLEILPAVEDHLDATEARHRLQAAGSNRIGFDESAVAVGRDPNRYR